jgi:hypothetical protein
MMNSGDVMGKMWTDYAIQLPNAVVPPYLLVEAGFSLLTWIMEDHGHREPQFDFWLSSSRMIIEKAFVILKNRFRSLLDCSIRVKMVDIAYDVPAMLAIHNVFINLQDIGRRNTITTINNNVEMSLSM